MLLYYLNLKVNSNYKCYRFRLKMGSLYEEDYAEKVDKSLCAKDAALFLCQFNHFQILELPPVDGETHQGTYLMKTIDAGGSRIDV